MNLQELKAEVKKMSKRANQRMVNMEKQGLTSEYSAYGRVKRYGIDRFGQIKRIEAGKTDKRALRSAYIQELGRINDFLNAETGSVADYKKYKKRTNALLGIETNDLTDQEKQTDNFFKLFDDLKRIYREVPGLKYLEMTSDPTQGFGVIKEFLQNKNYKRKTTVSLKRFVKKHLRLGAK